MILRRGDYLADWDYKRALRAEEWTERYLLGSCGPVTVIPAWKVDRERRAAQMALPASTEAVTNALTTSS